MERMTIRKWFWVWDYEKEERWLNEMAMAGWVLESVGFCKFNFVKCEPGEYTVRLEMHDPDEAYINYGRKFACVDTASAWIVLNDGTIKSVNKC